MYNCVRRPSLWYNLHVTSNTTVSIISGTLRNQVIKINNSMLDGMLVS